MATRRETSAFPMSRRASSSSRPRGAAADRGQQQQLNRPTTNLYSPKSGRGKSPTIRQRNGSVAAQNRQQIIYGENNTAPTAARVNAPPPPPPQHTESRRLSLYSRNSAGAASGDDRSASHAPSRIVRGGSRRPSAAGSVAPTRSRRGSSASPSAAPRAAPTPRKNGTRRVDEREVERRWREQLRRDGDAYVVLDDDDEEEAAAEAAAAPQRRRAGSRAARKRVSVSPPPPPRDVSVGPPRTQLDRELPFDYVYASRPIRGGRRDDGPPIVIATRRIPPPARRSSQPQPTPTPTPAKEAAAVPPQQTAVVRRPAPLSAAAVRQEASTGSDPLTAPLSMASSAGPAAAAAAAAAAAEPLSPSLAESDSARRAVYEAWRDRTGCTLYENVFVPATQCQSAEVPPFFEPTITARERVLERSMGASADALIVQQERVLRYRLATQQGARRTDFEDIQLSASDAAEFLPIVRVMRHMHEETNWAAGIATIEENARRMAAADAAYESAVAGYPEEALRRQRRERGEGAGGDAGEDGSGDGYWSASRALPRTEGGPLEAPPLRESGSTTTTTGAAPPSPSKARGSGGAGGMGTIAINSATTPGWLRRREFTQDEWRALQQGGKERRPDELAARNPNLPAWMHRIGHAQEEEEGGAGGAGDGASMSLSRHTTQPVFTIGQSRRVSIASASAEHAADERGLFPDDGDSLRHGESQSGRFSVPRPTRVDGSAQRAAAVVDNDVDASSYGHTPASTPPAIQSAAAQDAAPAAPPPGTQLLAGEGAAATRAAPAPLPPRPPEHQRPAPLPVVFTLHPFSSFEVTQQLKRMTWWAAARGLSAFTVCAGRDSLTQPRSYSPTFFPERSRFYGEVLAAVQCDLWLRLRVTVAAHDEGEGEVVLDIFAAAMTEARRQHWLNAEESTSSNKNNNNEEEEEEDDDDDTSAQGPLSPLATNRPQMTDASLPATLHSTAPPPQQQQQQQQHSSAASAPAPAAVVSLQPLSFFTDRPHPKGAQPSGGRATP